MKQQETIKDLGIAGIGFLPDRRQDDRRASDRRYFHTPVRFLTEDRCEYNGTLENISAGGLCIKSLEIPHSGENIILYIDCIGRFEATVMWRNDTHFGLQMALSPAKLERLELSISRFFQRAAPDAPYSDRRQHPVGDRRSHDRLEGQIESKVEACTDDNVKFLCSIANLSLNGIEVITDAQLRLGEGVQVGTFHGVISRKTQKGYAIIRQARADS